MIWNRLLGNINKKALVFLRSLSLEQGLKAILIGLVTGNLIIVGVVAIVLSRNAQWQRTQELQEERALALAMEVRTRLDDVEQQLRYLQKVRGLAQLPSEIQYTLLEGLTRENNAYEMVAIVQPQGQLLSVIAPHLHAEVDINQFAAQKIQNSNLATAIAQQIRYIDAIELEPALNVPMTTLVLPLQDQDGRPQGVIVATINLGFLNPIVAHSQISETGYVYILDQQNQIIAKQLTAAETDQEIALDVLTAQTMPEIFNQNSTESTHVYNGLRGLDVLGTRSLIYGVNWQVVVELPLQEIYAPIRRLMVAMLIVLLLSISMTIFVSIRIAHWLVAPLQKLTQTANQISQGQFLNNSTVEGFKEWQILADAFNYMTQRIRDSFESLESKNDQLSETLNELKSTQLQLIQNEKMSSIGQLVAGIAHEVNNPINFIYGNLTHANNYSQDLLDLISLYQKHYPAPNQEIEAALIDADVDFIKKDFPELLSSMRMGSQRVKEIVLSFRNFSRLDEAQHKSVDLHEGIDNTLIILRNRIKPQPEQQEIKITKEYGELPLVDCYPAQLNQVFMNLIVNAIDALEDLRKPNSGHRPEVKIKTAYQANSTIPQVCIRITDNGMGIPEQVKMQIFDPFFTTKPIGKGTGLGLSISYKIITEMHQGSIHCASEPGQGTIFEIKIPSKITTVGAIP
ncbi:MAG: ATP-binding protein [Cyanobacteria bacterium P01_G01_bin.54]